MQRSLAKSIRTLTAGLILVAPIAVVAAWPGSALASGCNSQATGSWSNNCQVQYGSVSNLVLGVQEFLNGFGDCGGSALADDGDFGPKTQAAVECFQSLSNLSPDGDVGPLTWGKMQSELRDKHVSGSWTLWGSFPSYDNYEENNSSLIWNVQNAGKTGWVRM
jgi:peptidoglycan hydrolase-like protein with peptidoglycan-binding domain